MGIKVLYAGDSPVGGAANYLLGILKFMRAQVTHLAPSEKISASTLKKRFDVIIFSDYSRKQLEPAAETAVLRQIENGTGFLMIGGWGSFSGPFGAWKGSRIEKILPVTCKASDDRTNFPGGASLALKNSGGFLSSKIFKEAPAVCGLNDFRPKNSSKTLVAVRKVISNGRRAKLASKENPLLVVSTKPFLRTAALATDLAPHWCGGLVDWGKKTLKIKVTPKIQIQVGNYYVEFVSSLLNYLAGR